MRKKCSSATEIQYLSLVFSAFAFPFSFSMFCFSLPICGSFSSVNENIPIHFITHLLPPTTYPVKDCCLKSRIFFSLAPFETASCLTFYCLRTQSKLFNRNVKYSKWETICKIFKISENSCKFYSVRKAKKFHWKIWNILLKNNCASL